MFTIKIRKHLPAIILLCITAHLSAQGAGMPFIRNFPSEEFRANQHNGRISFETEEGENSYTEFIIHLLYNQSLHAGQK
jgi:hypothetical protein